MPTAAILNQQSQPVVDDNSGDWWGGVLNCAATVTLAAAVALTAFTTTIAQNVSQQQQDEPAGSLIVGQVEEEYWYRTLRRIPHSAFGGGTNIDDEDFWANSVAPIPPTIYQVLPYLPDLSDEPAGSLYGQPDEDYWQLGPFPSPPSLYQRFPYLPDPEEIPAGNLFGLPEEDFWQNPVFPVGSYPVPKLFTDDDVVSVLNTDEDFWVNLVAPVWAYPSQIFTTADDITLPPVVDEDFWQNPTSPVYATFGHIYAPDVEELSAGSFFGPPEEDFWQNSVAPVPAALLWTPQYVYDVQEPAGSLGAFINVIAPDMFSVISIFVQSGLPVISFPDYVRTTIFMSTAISQLLNIINSSGYPDYYKLAASNTILLQNNFYKTFGTTTPTFIDALIATGDANNLGFVDYIHRSAALLAAT